MAEMHLGAQLCLLTKETEVPHSDLYNGCVLCQPEGTTRERTAGDKAFQAAGDMLALCRNKGGSSEA